MTLKGLLVTTQASAQAKRRRAGAMKAAPVADVQPPALRLSTSAQGGKLTTLSRGLNILEFVAKSARFVRLRDVAEHFDLDRSAALRFLRTLEMEGYITRHQAMKMYSIGPKLLSFPRLSAQVERVIEVSRPALLRIARESGQLSHLAVLSGSQAVLVEVVASNAPVSIRQAVGDLEPINSSAVGKAIFAFMPDADRQLLGQEIPFYPHTVNTITNLAGLERESEAIRASGVAFDRQEGNDQVCCIGCPIFDENRFPIASIGLSYVHAHLPAPIDEMLDDINLILAAAREIEALLV